MQLILSINVQFLIYSKTFHILKTLPVYLGQDKKRNVDSSVDPQIFILTSEQQHVKVSTCPENRERRLRVQAGRIFTT